MKKSDFPEIPEEIQNFFSAQLSAWELARNNYAALDNALRKPFSVNGFSGFVQCNPQRSGSTNAKVDKESIAKRNCFLCKDYRPPQQSVFEILPGWELLVNPFPILNPHFTIVSTEHRDQQLDFNTAFELARRLPGLVVFYNDDGAGASAPDHCHYQAVAKDALPLIALLESGNSSNANHPEEPGSKLPFRVIAGNEGDEKSIILPKTVNAFFWLSSSGKLRFILVPRRAHRPDLFFRQPPARRAISPGAIDMAGILVTPYREDFELITEEEILSIYNQTGFDAE